MPRVTLFLNYLDPEDGDNKLTRNITVCSETTFDYVQCIYMGGETY